jgi:hypothetical protein
MREPVADIGVQFADGAVDAASEFAGGDPAEPAFDEVQPTGAGGGEVQMKPGVRREPAFELRRLVGGVVVVRLR